jgi:ABC-type sugar transport system ATPase subunit
MSKLELVDIDKTYGKTDVLNKISLKVEGRILRHSRARPEGGKSTLLRILAGIARPDSGQVLINGKDETEHTRNK